MGSPDCYPGADARADEVIRLANHYRGAANDLLRLVEEKGARRIAPCRLCAVHAIELYLNAFLLKLGHPPERHPRQRPRPGRACGAGQRRRSGAAAADGDPPGDDDAGARVPRPALRPGHGRGGAAQPALGHPRRDRPQGHERGRRLRPAAERGLSAGASRLAHRMSARLGNGPIGSDRGRDAVKPQLTDRRVSEGLSRSAGRRRGMVVFAVVPKVNGVFLNVQRMHNPCTGHARELAHGAEG